MVNFLWCSLRFENGHENRTSSVVWIISVSFPKFAFLRVVVFASCVRLSLSLSHFCGPWSCSVFVVCLFRTLARHFGSELKWLISLHLAPSVLWPRLRRSCLYWPPVWPRPPPVGAPPRAPAARFSSSVGSVRGSWRRLAPATSYLLFLVLFPSSSHRLLLGRHLFRPARGSLSLIVLFFPSTDPPPQPCPLSPQS